MDEHITTGQAIILLTTTRLALAISTMPTVNLPPYNQDIWIMNLLSIIYTLVAFIPFLFLANKFNNLNLVGYTRLIYGKVLGSIIVVLYGICFFMNGVNGVTILTELTTSTILVQESNISILIFTVLVIFFFITRGLISVVRSFQLLAPIALFITIFLMILGIDNVDFSLLRPVLSESSFLDINRGALLLSLYFFDIFILVMIVPELKKKKNINFIAISSVVISLVCLSAIVIITQGAVGIEQSRHSNAAFLLYVRLIDVFGFFERIDSIFVAAWLITGMIRNASFLYISTRAFRELFNKMEDDRIILVITSLALGIVSFFIINNRSVIGIRKEFDLFYNIIFIVFAIIIPLITCIVYFFRRKSLRETEPSHNIIDKLE